MQTTLLKAKLHRARVTHSELEYEGSCAIDGNLLDKAGIREYEQIHIYNVNNGARFTTYAIRAQDGSGVVSINGAAARHAAVNDIIIICAYAILNQAELLNYRPTLIYVDAQNKILRTGHSIPMQAA
jgi:aspartate 1-decarboxylase